eukprot:g19219.t1
MHLKDGHEVTLCAGRDLAVARAIKAFAATQLYLQKQHLLTSSRRLAVKTVWAPSDRSGFVTKAIFTCNGTEAIWAPNARVRGGVAEPVRKPRPRSQRRSRLRLSRHSSMRAVVCLGSFRWSFCRWAVHSNDHFTARAS